MGKTYTQEEFDAALEQMRVSTLEEAAQWFEGNEDDVGYAIATEIRGLK